jgi:hypothetical protein
MQDTHLMTEMIEKCRRVILDQDEHALEHQPRPLRKTHLIRMCDRMIDHVDDWPAVKLNRWIGFIQCALIANRSLDLEEAKQISTRTTRSSSSSEARVEGAQPCACAAPLAPIRPHFLSFR